MVTTFMVARYFHYYYIRLLFSLQPSHKASVAESRVNVKIVCDPIPTTINALLKL